MYSTLSVSSEHVWYKQRGTQKTDQINSEIQMIDCGMVTQDVYCFRAQWLIKDQHR